VALPVEEFCKGKKCALFSVDSANLFSLNSKDYGDGKSDPANWIRDTLRHLEIVEVDGPIVLLTLPRILGYAFNPVSFWFCHDQKEQLRAVVAEVNNTFGERHFYLCCRPDHRAIKCDDRLKVRKAFHVSPFLEVAGEYRFGFDCQAGLISVRIDLFDEKGPTLTTSMRGSPRPLSNFGLVKTLAGFPLQMLKVIGLIYWQALKLHLKGVTHHAKPEPPVAMISR
jgi:DUF1365 family protein